VTDLRKAQPANKPVYAQTRAILPATDDREEIVFNIWHKVAAIQPSKAPLTALGMCGHRFEPEGFLYRERTLADWGNDDDLCECAAAVPTDEQAKAAGAMVRIGGKEETGATVG
jgi:hypothetical protein